MYQVLSKLVKINSIQFWPQVSFMLVGRQASKQKDATCYTNEGFGCPLSADQLRRDEVLCSGIKIILKKSNGQEWIFLCFSNRI